MWRGSKGEVIYYGLDADGFGLWLEILYVMVYYLVFLKKEMMDLIFYVCGDMKKNIYIYI